MGGTPFFGVALPPSLAERLSCTESQT